MVKQITKEEFLVALETTEDKQTYGMLHEVIGGINCFCTLGIGFKEAGYEMIDYNNLEQDEVPDHDLSGFIVPGKTKYGTYTLGTVLESLDIDFELERKIIWWNDNDKLTFKEIAANLRIEWNMPKEVKETNEN